MKYLYVSILVFFSNTMFSQSYEDIKKLDTIYIPFKAGKFNTKIEYPEEKNGFKNREYSYKKNNSKETTLSFEFVRNYDKILEHKRVNQSFLKKIKKNIIEINSVKNLDYQDIACNLFHRGKIIYILDFSERKDKGIMLYRVWYINYCIIGE
jgi:hypothetical protein